MTWFWIAIAVLLILLIPLLAVLIWARRSGMTPAEAARYTRDLGIDLVRLPGRLRRIAADPRTPRRARWWLIGLAIYVASPIDPIPDFLPVIGHLDELILVPIILRHVCTMIPNEVWQEHFGGAEAVQDGAEL
jgi:uncharacterized membrane protein YkvA (DUF1232 family)